MHSSRAFCFGRFRLCACVRESENERERKKEEQRAAKGEKKDISIEGAFVFFSSSNRQSLRFRSKKPTFVSGHAQQIFFFGFVWGCSAGCCAVVGAVIKSRRGETRDETRGREGGREGEKERRTMLLSEQKKKK